MKQHLVWVVLLGFLLPACTSSTSLSQKESGLAEAVKIQGEALLLQGDYTAALSKLLEARKMTPKDPYLHNSLGLAYMGKKRDDLAVASFKKALDLKPDYTEALNNLGAAFLRLKKWDTAISAFKKVLEDLLYPTPQYPLSNLGWAYLGKKEYLQAKYFFSQALDEAPGFVAATHGLALVYLDTRQVDEAIEFLSNSLRRIPDSAILHADLARAHEIRGQIGRARQSWKKVREYSEENSKLAQTARKRLSELD